METTRFLENNFYLLYFFLIYDLVMNRLQFFHLVNMRGNEIGNGALGIWMAQGEWNDYCSEEDRQK